MDILEKKHVLPICGYYKYKLALERNFLNDLLKQNGVIKKQSIDALFPEGSKSSSFDINHYDDSDLKYVYFYVEIPDDFIHFTLKLMTQDGYYQGYESISGMEKYKVVWESEKIYPIN